jgi:beta-fructofuranosidase
MALGVIEDHPDPLGTPSDYLRAASPQELLARQCIATVRDLLDGRAGPPRHLHLPTHLMPGPSCTCPRHAPELTIPPRLSESFDERFSPSGHGRRHPTTTTDPARPGPTAGSARHRSPVHHRSPRSEMTTDPLPDEFFPSLHVRPLQGWVNDPNGIHRIGDTWHLFYQHNPSSPWHDRISWGHATSRDLLRWRDQGIALRPRQGAPDAAGCWSGVGLIQDGVSSLVYSAVTELDGPSTTVIAPQRADRSGWSPSITAASSADAPGLRAMRDPFIVTIGERRYAIHGAGDHDQRPSVIIHDCTDWENWVYLGPLLTGDDTIAAIHAPASIWECPQLVQLDGRWVLIVSLWVEAENLMDHLTGVAYLTGDVEMRGDRPVFTPTEGGTFDAGPDFYAPQAVVDEGRVLIWGWSWEGAGRTDEAIERSGYNGSLTFPRTLRHLDGAVIMEPASELTQLRHDEIDPLDLPGERHAEICATGAGELRLRDAATGEVHLSLSISTDARIFLDGSLVEAFVAGRQSHTERLYARRGLSIHADHSVQVSVWQLRVRDENGAPSSRALV